jgi:hypothetical protein
LEDDVKYGLHLALEIKSLVPIVTYDETIIRRKGEEEFGCHGWKRCDTIPCGGGVLKPVDKMYVRHPSVLAWSRSYGKLTNNDLWQNQRIIIVLNKL